MIGNLDDIEIDNFEKTDLSFSENLRRASNNSEISGVFPMRELLGLDKALQRIQGELANNSGKLTDLDKHIGRENRKLEEVENDPAINDKEALKREIASRLDDLKEERSQTEFEIIIRERQRYLLEKEKIRSKTSKKIDEVDTKKIIEQAKKEERAKIAKNLSSVGSANDS